MKNIVQPINLHIVDAGSRKIKGKMMGIVRFRFEHIGPGAPPVVIKTDEVEMMCHLNFQESIIKNLRRLKHLPDRAWRDPAALKPAGPEKEDI